MKISIDTKEDSHDDIRKVIKMLQHLVDESSYSNSRNIFDDPSPSLSSNSESAAPATNAFSAMFGSNDVPSEPAASKSEEKIETYGEYKLKKLDLDAEIVPY